MKKVSLKSVLIYAMSVLAGVALVSCSNDDDNNPGNGASAASSGCYVLNCGNWGGNDASLQYYDYETGLATAPDADANIFAVQNGAMLGDLAQDMLWVENKLFVSVSGSQKLEVLDEEGRRLREPYLYSEEGASPRMLATDGKYVYVTNYDGNVYVYSASTAEFVKTIAVGTRPEGISCTSGVLVVNNSGDLYAYNGTVSLIGLKSGEKRDIQLVNPYTASVVCNGDVYIIDSGNYYDVPSTVYRVSVEEATVEALGFSASAIAAYEDKIYYVNNEWSYEVNNYVASPLYSYDTVTGESVELLPAEAMTNVNSLSVNPENGDIYVGYAQYGVLGTMNVYTLTGEAKGTFTVGYYTTGAYFEN